MKRHMCPTDLRLGRSQRAPLRAMKATRARTLLRAMPKSILSTPNCMLTMGARNFVT